jgi:integrase
MPAQITERPKRRDGDADTAAQPAVSAQILQFPTGGADDPDAARALARVVQALTKQQSIALRREIGVLSTAIAKQIAVAEPVDAPEGLRPRHSEKCSLKGGGAACSCRPKWEAWVWSTHDKKKIRKTHNTKQEAIKWRRRHLGLAESGQLRAPVRITLGETACLWIEKAKVGEIRNRSGRKYKPSALRTLETDFRLRLIPELGTQFMSDIERPDLQNLVNFLQGSLSPSKVHGCVNAARVLWRDFDLITGTNNALIIDPTKGLRLPAVPGSGTDRIATADEARRLIDALKVEDRALWATALYSGMRHGEIRALRAHNIDLALKRIKVRAGWDQYEGEIDPKTEKGRRTTVIIELLETLLIDQLERTGRSGNDLVFGRDADTPFNSNTVHSRARRAWKIARERDDKEGIIPEHERIRSIGLHDCRHTAVSHMLDAGITIDKVSKFIGHSSITVTIDRYGHLLPGGEAEAADILNEYHARRRQRRMPVAL